GMDARTADIEMGDQEIGRTLEQRVAQRRGTALGEGVQVAMDRDKPVGGIGRLVDESEMADLAGRRRPARDGDAEVELAQAEGLDLPHADARFGGMEIDGGIGAQPAM